MKELSEKIYWSLSLPLFELEGIDSRKFLNGQTTADIFAAKEGALLKTCWLSPVGRLKSLLEFRCLDNKVQFIVLRGDSKEVFSSFNNVIFPFDEVKIKQSGQINRVQEISEEISWRSLPVEWLSSDESLPKKFESYKTTNQKFINKWFIDQGLPSSDLELNGNNNPFELGLSDLVNLNKGCYLGQETLAKVKNSGKLKCQLKVFYSNRIIHAGESLKVKSDSNESTVNAGLITSSIPNPDSSSMGLALVRSHHIIENKIKLVDGSTVLELKQPIGFVGI